MLKIDFNEHHELRLRIVISIIFAVAFFYLMPFFWDMIGALCCQTAQWLNAPDICKFLN